MHGMVDFNPTYERLFDPFEISPGVILLPGEYRFTRFRSNLLSTATKASALGQHQPDVRRLLVGQGRGGVDLGHLQAPATVHVHLQYEPDVRATSRGATSSPASSRRTSTTRSPRDCRSRTWFSTTTDPATSGGRAAYAGRCSPGTTCSSHSIKAGSRRTSAAGSSSERPTARCRRSSSTRFASSRLTSASATTPNSQLPTPKALSGDRPGIHWALGVGG